MNMTDMHPIVRMMMENSRNGMTTIIPLATTGNAAMTQPAGRITTKNAGPPGISSPVISALQQNAETITV